ncbi:MAG: hypothetical protein DWQ35_09880 [Planctomycetota bacterium]|nr:MAG: hypothetical protein DWQ35_09880 [Planctomycetota bacterium]REK25700.1 MAG: hypothetical protein DWQ42_10620 [Planctomycetota bacterium]
MSSNSRFDSGSLVHQLDRVVDAGFLAVLFVAPYVMGGRHPIGRLVFVGLAVAIAVAWSARQCLAPKHRWVHSPAQWVLGGGVLICLAQLVPWPAAWIERLSPQIGVVLPSAAQTPATDFFLPWSRLSLVPAETLGGLVMFVAYGLLFLVACQRIHSLGDVERFLKWIAGSAILMAVVGLLQYLAGNGKFLWIYDHPYRNPDLHVLGSFVNRNHFAHFLALGIGPLIWWVITKLNQDEHGAQARDRFAANRSRSTGSSLVLPLLMLALGVVLFAGLMSLSRGGAVAIAAAICVSCIFLARASLLKLRYCLWGAGAAALILGALMIHGLDAVEGRLDDLTAGSIDELDTKQIRRLLWKANMAAFVDHPWLGIGVGTHRYFYPLYLTQYFDKDFTHAESGYLQIASETGVAGLVLLLSALGLILMSAARLFFLPGEARHRHGHHGEAGGRTRYLACSAAVVAGLAASIVHSVADFVWYIPACIAVTVMLIACLVRMCQLWKAETSAHERPHVGPSRKVGVALLSVSVLVGGSLVYNRVGPALAAPSWDRYLHASVIVGEKRQDEFLLAPVQTSGELAAQTEAMIRHLESVVRYDRHHVRAHLRLAGLYLRRFEQLQMASDNAMSLNQLGEAAIASQFASRSELDAWLDRAVGPNRVKFDQALWHVRRGLALCPLQGEGYVYLSELCFLNGGDRARKTAHVQQALRVRPGGEGVLFAAGKDAMLLGDFDSAVEYWRRCYHKDGRYKRQLVDLLSSLVPIEFFIEVFEPQFGDWPMLLSHFLATMSPEQQQRFSNHFARHGLRDISELQGDDLTDRWLSLRAMHARMKQIPEALYCSRKAFESAPHEKRVRRVLGEDLLTAEQFEEAVVHLRWVEDRTQDDAQLRALLERAIRGRARQVSDTEPGQRSPRH